MQLSFLPFQWNGQFHGSLESSFRTKSSTAQAHTWDAKAAFSSPVCLGCICYSCPHTKENSFNAFSVASFSLAYAVTVLNERRRVNAVPFLSRCCIKQVLHKTHTHTHIYRQSYPMLIASWFVPEWHLWANVSVVHFSCVYCSCYCARTGSVFVCLTHLTICANSYSVQNQWNARIN